MGTHTHPEANPHTRTCRTPFVFPSLVLSDTCPRVCALAGNYPDAFKCYTRALELDPRSAEALVARGAAHANQRDLAAAEADLRQAIRLDPTHRNAAPYLAAVLRRGGADATDAAATVAAAVAEGAAAVRREEEERRRAALEKVRGVGGGERPAAVAATPRGRKQGAGEGVGGAAEQNAEEGDGAGGSWRERQQEQLLALQQHRHRGGAPVHYASGPAGPGQQDGGSGGGPQLPEADRLQRERELDELERELEAERRARAASGAGLGPDSWPGGRGRSGGGGSKSRRRRTSLSSNSGGSSGSSSSSSSGSDTPGGCFGKMHGDACFTCIRAVARLCSARERKGRTRRTVRDAVRN